MKNETKEKDYKQIYDAFMDYEQQIHEKNLKRIRIGLKCIVIIPLIFLIMLLATDSSKIIFLTLWIASLFGIAVYLIHVEYADYQLQEHLLKFDNEKRKEPDALMGRELQSVSANLRATLKILDQNLNAQEELRTSRAQEDTTAFENEHAKLKDELDGNQKEEEKGRYE